MVDFGTCLKCGSLAVVCKCMLEQAAPVASTAPQPMQAVQPRSAMIAHQMRQAGWHNDAHAFAALFLQAGFNSEESGVFFKAGQADRKQGLPCSCKQCCAARRAHRDAGAGI